jgi:hypothetical protein
LSIYQENKFCLFPFPVHPSFWGRERIFGIKAESSVEFLWPSIYGHLASGEVSGLLCLNKCRWAMPFDFSQILQMSEVIADFKDL